VDTAFIVRKSWEHASNLAMGKAASSLAKKIATGSAVPPRLPFKNQLDSIETRRMTSMLKSKWAEVSQCGTSVTNGEAPITNAAAKAWVISRQDPEENDGAKCQCNADWEVNPSWNGLSVLFRFRSLLESPHIASLVLVKCLSHARIVVDEAKIRLRKAERTTGLLLLVFHSNLVF